VCLTIYLHVVSVHNFILTTKENTEVFRLCDEFTKRFKKSKNDFKSLI